MHGIPISIKQEGRKTVYHSKIRVPGNTRKIVEYLKTDKTPKNNSQVRVISVKSSGNTIERVMTSSLPDTYAVRMAIGNQPIHVKYDIAYSDDIIVVTARNPDLIDNFFKFTEEIIIEQISKDKIEFKRTAKIFNAGKSYFSQSYQEYDDYFNDKSLSLFKTFIDEITD